MENNIDMTGLEAAKRRLLAVMQRSDTQSEKNTIVTKNRLLSEREQIVRNKEIRLADRYRTMQAALRETRRKGVLLPSSIK